MPEPHALVVFPSDGPSSGHRLAVRSVQDSQGALVCAVGIDMPRILDEVGTPDFAVTCIVFAPDWPKHSGCPLTRR